ncbi:hypothetical protein GW17_00057756 [Ensete ventricosum]|nr:hypothetical protein GW17_00057756 [Ensete ventricosum]RZR82145.1 hypothetical protein BHM03_00008509 [Ensete ventricosum]
MRIHNSQLIGELMAANGEACKLRKVLKVKQCQILEYREEAITDYKAPDRFKEGVERTKVTLYQFGYQIALVNFKVRYPNLKLEEDSFTNQTSMITLMHHIVLPPKLSSSA